ncbi:LOW QUALITY PROTEIN: H-2 class II histocompatibility antigen, A-U alpha chain-like [Melanotaenia boesemani]|uniref:LOW QUALITY PROTEIN: H-2 class II histocompatibility antigen, A-U alpha chain-like n=1 Tax=Melanotaenia boesemani TaxID=1250792 RepID=UPI001C05BE03|nr:LOW QUALITY PROTEIN: H-2 class II histocompatibility antigen, A-U alpha chain-like [Melanotaenia boesemani]
MTTFYSHLKRSALIILMLNSFCAFLQKAHEITYVVGCFENGTTETLLEFDSDEVFYVDFEKGEVEYTGPYMPGFDPSQLFQDLQIYKNALRNSKACKAIVAYGTIMEKQPSEEKDPPESILYTAEEVDKGVENSLICFVNHFYPPLIKVTWTKNGQPVSEGVSLSRYYPNQDQTFHQFSTLTFTPTETDIYSCTVEHMALDRPQTRIWEPDFHHQHFELDVFCSVGLILGLLGIVAGTFLIVKTL